MAAGAWISPGVISASPSTASPIFQNKLISRINGMGFSSSACRSPYNGEIVGMYTKVITFVCARYVSSPSFPHKGYMYVINREGYVILHSAHPSVSRSQDNYFRDLYGAGSLKASEQMKRDIRNNHQQVHRDDDSREEIFSGIYSHRKKSDWYLITSVPNNAVSPSSKYRHQYFLFHSVRHRSYLYQTHVFLVVQEQKQRAQLEKIAFVGGYSG